jgi:predicted small metal-binding protein
MVILRQRPIWAKLPRLSILFPVSVSFWLLSRHISNLLKKNIKTDNKCGLITFSRDFNVSVINLKYISISLEVIMYKLKCTDIDPATTCKFETEGETKKEVIDNLMEHAGKAHAEEMKNIDKAQVMTKLEEVIDKQM